MSDMPIRTSGNRDLAEKLGKLITAWVAENKEEGDDRIHLVVLATLLDIVSSGAVVLFNEHGVNGMLDQLREKTMAMLEATKIEPTTVTTTTLQ